MPSITDQAVCVRRWDWSETSQTVSLFSREHGIVRAVAKGAKRENARFSGGLEVATRGEMIVRIKAGDGLSLLIAWDLQEVFPGARASVRAFHATMLLMDLVQRAMSEHDPHPRIFDALVGALRSVGSESVDHELAKFLWAILLETGHKPTLGEGSATGAAGAAREKAGVYLFYPRRGGVIVANGGSAGPPESGGEQATGDDALVWKVRGETVEYLRSLDRGEMTPPRGETPERAVRLLASYFREVGHTELPTLAGYLEVVRRG